MEDLRVSKDFVLAAYNAACPDWKKKIEGQFPLLVPHLLEKQIKGMASYRDFYDKSFGEPLLFTEGNIHVKITQPTLECLFRAWDFVKSFISANKGYLVMMDRDKIILKRM